MAAQKVKQWEKRVMLLQKANSATLEEQLPVYRTIESLAAQQHPRNVWKKLLQAKVRGTAQGIRYSAWSRFPTRGH